MPMFRKSMLVLVVIAVAALGGTLYGLYGREDAAPLAAGTAEVATEQQASIAVYVSGAVNKPGVVTLPAGSRTVDAVNACGGVLPTADPDQINMAQELKDGEQLRVPERAQVTATSAAAGVATGAATAGSASGATPANTAGGLVNINTASEQELDTLPGIGPAMAKRIIEYRTSEGGFKKLEDIKNIKGIGDAKYNKLKDKICI